MKQWLMTQKLVALNTMYKKTPATQATYRTPKGAEKQLDYILVNRKYLRWSNDAEANDMIHMESDHRRVMAQVVIPEKESQHSDENRQKNRHHTTVGRRSENCRDLKIRRTSPIARERSHGKKWKGT